MRALSLLPHTCKLKGVGLCHSDRGDEGTVTLVAYTGAGLGLLDALNGEGLGLRDSTLEGSTWRLLPHTGKLVAVVFRDSMCHEGDNPPDTGDLT
mmetsp:Transcript_147759/g.472859  ORF Transcript_147759/g.472859 Transcript_147759/m.472859 type:complete len:95 (+) Transcript_147759:322-606(+)